MSSSVPPAGPPSGPPPGPTEYLEQGAGDPVGSSRSGGGKRAALVAGGVLGLAAVGGGVWAAMSFLGTGPQPAEALPASTLGYVSVDLDPSGSQKIEALRTLRKFEAFRDEVGLDTDDDIRKFLFEEMTGGSCDGVDYDDDVEPWLGDRAAVAAVDAGEDGPAAVFVLQVRDAEGAEAGLRAVKECLGSGEEGAWVVDGDWAVVAETQEIADRVSGDAADAPLTDDEDFTEWTDEAGDAGIATLYAAPEAGPVIAERIGDFGGQFAPTPTFSYEEESAPAPGGLDEVTAALEDFRGMAATLRFDGGALELEVAAGSAATEDFEGTDAGGQLVSSLPDDTAVALGLGLGEGWADRFLDGLAAGFGGGQDPEAMLAELFGITGVELPEDLETLTEGGVAVAVGEDFDPAAFFGGGSGSLPAAVKLRGDVDEIESVLDKVGAPLGGLDRTVDGDTVVVGPDETWREEVADGGDLGGQDRFRDVVEEVDGASGVFYVDFDAGFFADLGAGDEQVQRNLEPLAALGVSSWVDDGVAHSVVKITTE